jgi:SagB-type dehydrogenase family enzyme
MYPVEIYVVAADVEGLPGGLYHYDTGAHALDVLRAEPCVGEFLASMAEDPNKSSASALLVLTAVLPRTMSKYLFRGYRTALYDTGAVLGSLYLTAAALGVGYTALGGFYDDEVGRFLGIDNVDENVMCLFSVGRAQPSQRDRVSSPPAY